MLTYLPSFNIIRNAPDVDLALLKIDAPKEKLKSLTLGQSKVTS